MKNLIITSILLLLGLAAPQTTLWGSHLSGLEISHEVVGPYVIKLKARYYVDRGGFSPSTIIFLVNFGQPNDTSFQSGPQTLIPYADGICPQSSAIGLDLYEYEETWTIPLHMRDRRLTFGMTVQHASSGINVGSSQETYVETIYNPQNLSGSTFRNTTAQYPTAPRFAFSLNAYNALHLPMIDSDGDSLTYSMVAPRINPTNSNPPQPPFTWLQPLGPNNVVFDSLRGILSILPNVSPGCYRVAFWTREYRNGVLVGESMQDYSLCFYNNNAPTTRPRPAARFVTDEFMSPLSAPIAQVPPIVPNMPSIYVDFYPCEGSSSNLMLNFLDASYQNTIVTSDLSTVVPGGQLNRFSINGNDDLAVAIELGNSPIQPTTFSVILERSNCISNMTFQVFVNIKEVRRNLITASRQTICQGVNNTIFLDAPQNSLNSTYQWSPQSLFPSPSSPNQLINISAPTTVYVTVSSGTARCEDIDSLTIGTIQQAINIAQLDSCWGNTMRFRASSSQLNGTYRWSPSSLFTGQTSNVASPVISQPVDVGVTYTDVSGCTASDILPVRPNSRISLRSTPETCGALNGAAIATGGTSYLWSNGDTSAAITGLASGLVFVTATDGNGCLSIDSVFVGRALGVNWGLSTTFASCSVADGTATVNLPASGGPYSLSWSHGVTGNSVSGLAPGRYSVTISNVNCSAHRNFEIRTHNTCFWRIEGHVYNDHVNPDCAADTSSSPIRNGIVSISDVSGASIGYAVTDYSGYYAYNVNAPGAYNLAYQVPSYANTIAACPSTLSVSVTSSQQASNGHDFYVDFLETNDAEAVGYLPRMRYGINNYFIPSIRNIGNTTVGGAFSLKYSSNLVYTGSLNNGFHNAATRTFTWTFSNLEVGASQSFLSYFAPAPSAAAGDPFSLTGTVQINGTDTNPANDTFRVNGAIVNSFDPNEKSVFPQGSGPEHGILESQRKLTYTIDFENLGNDTAYAVLIHDVIDTSKLDIRSVRPIASSHDFEMGIKGLDTLTFHFQDINLLARSQNPQRNKGFVAFSIDLKPSLPLGTRIENRASIFFDYNAAIVTNTAYNTIVRPSGIEAPSLSLSAKLFPNPTNANATLEIDLEEGTELRIAVLDMMGRAVGNSQQSTWLPEGRHQFALDSEQWPAGMYFVQLVTPKGVVALQMQVVR